MLEWLESTSPILATLVRILIVLLVGVTISLVIQFSAGRVERRLEKNIQSIDRLKRLRTLLQAGTSIAHFIVGVIILLMILFELEINVTPILASAGVAGLALSLGSQTFIRDFFGGLLILIENQFTVGDIIKVGENTGSVERISLRATYLRDFEGRLITIPNGDIRTVTNLTADWSRAVVTLSVPRDADVDRVLEALDEAGRAAQSDETVSADLLDTPEVQGWVDLSDQAVQVRFMAKTTPGRQWYVAQVLRRYANQYLNQYGVRNDGSKG